MIKEIRFAPNFFEILQVLFYAAYCDQFFHTLALFISFKENNTVEIKKCGL